MRTTCGGWPAIGNCANGWVRLRAREPRSASTRASWSPASKSSTSISNGTGRGDGLPPPSRRHRGTVGLSTARPRWARARVYDLVRYPGAGRRRRHTDHRSTACRPSADADPPGSRAVYRAVPHVSLGGASRDHRARPQHRLSGFRTARRPRRRSTSCAPAASISSTASARAFSATRGGAHEHAVPARAQSAGAGGIRRHRSFPRQAQTSGLPAAAQGGTRVRESG